MTVANPKFPKPRASEWSGVEDEWSSKSRITHPTHKAANRFERIQICKNSGGERLRRSCETSILRFMFINSRSLLVICLAITFFARAAWADTAAIEGIAKDSNGKALKSADIRIE